eukprot:10478594-Alexandrium_andersonii.AAC.1
MRTSLVGLRHVLPPKEGHSNVPPQRRRYCRGTGHWLAEQNDNDTNNSAASRIRRLLLRHSIAHSPGSTCPRSPL